MGASRGVAGMAAWQGTARDVAQAAMAGSNLVIELPHQLGRRSHHQ